MTWLTASLIVIAAGVSTKKLDQYQTVHVDESFSSRAYGTELLFLENDYNEQKSYRFEDFFWTGSGDGDIEDDPWTTEQSSTVYKTETITSTIYMETPSTAHNTSAQESTTKKCSINCEPSITTTERISPSPTSPLYPEDNYDDKEDADREFWLLTVLKSGGKDPVITNLTNSLAKLYKTAFQRQQERHLGIMNNRNRRQAPAPTDKPVKVYIHKIEKDDMNNNGGKKIQVLYHVSVAGKPVDAFTAADDMTLVSDDEVTNELGYPFLIKAEPYLKPAPPQSLARSKNTWMFIGVSIVALLVILLLVAFITLGLTKRKRNPSATGLDNRRQIFERGVLGADNSAFVPDAKANTRNKGYSPTYVNFRDQPSNQTIRSGISVNRPQSSFSITSSSSSTSLSISPLMGLKSKQRTPPKKPPRPKAAIKRIAPELLDSDSSGSKRDSPDTILIGNYDPRVVSPKSYLSMPSVKSFPRGNMPEPLNKVLEPVSVLHLDMPDDDPALSQRTKTPSRPILTRHGSIGTVGDPGVIGPVVWNMHCQRLQHGVSVDEGIDDMKVGSNVSRMRKRFHDLLDDTFSLFGSSRRNSQDDSKPNPIEVKSHSAINNRPDDTIQPVARPRPKTTDLRKVKESPGRPKGAWASTAPSPLIRPLSADFTKPKVNVEHVLAEGKFNPKDPAVPLIAAIRSEIEKCSLPGSTADLRK